MPARYWLFLPLAAVACASTIATPATAPTAPTRPPGHDDSRHDDSRRNDGFSFEPATHYRSDVPRPGDLLGHEFGERYSEHRDVLRVVRAIDAASDRVELIDYGRTPEGRALVLALVSSPENLARKEALAKGLIELSDPRLVPDAEVAARSAAQPAIVWLSYNVHGNEPSGTEAALATLWHLAASEDEAAVRTRAETMIVIDPCLNPDGRDRYVHWFQSVVGSEPDPEPAAREHDEPAPGGRVNHYYFDLNRDWAYATQDETRRRLEQLRRFPPQVHVDFHEMYPESSYFFFPADLPRNLNLPQSTLDWGERFGQGNAAAFDRFGWPYYTGEQFDLLYPGYGDSFPSLRGAIGMTYEQAGHSAGGLAYRRTDQTVLTLADRVAHHFTASLSTIATAVEGRAGLLDHWRSFHADAIAAAARGPMREIALLPGLDRTSMSELLSLLLRHGIEIGVARAAFVANGVHGYDGHDVAERVLPEGTLLISLEQPQSRLAKALLEPRAGVERTTFYDISAWSLPYAWGIEACWLEQPAAVEQARLRAADSDTSPVANPLRRSGGATPDPADTAVAWVLPWGDAAAPAAALELLGGDVRARFLPRPFASATRAYPAGSLVIAAPPRAATGQRAALAGWLGDVGATWGVTFEPLASGFTAHGPDLGSEQAVVLQPPRIVLLASKGAGFGELRFLLERELFVPFTCVEPGALGQLDLADWNLVVVPDGVRDLDDAKAPIERFLRNGGTVVALGSSAFWFTKERSGITDVTAKPKDEKNGDKAKDGKDGGKDGTAAKDGTVAKDDEATQWKKTAQRERDATLGNMPGALFEVELDPGHPLAFGLPERVPQLATGTEGFELHGGGDKVGRFVVDGRVSGFAGDETVKKLAGKFWLVEAQVGRGRVVLFSENPTFRLGFRGPIRVLYNALVFGSR